MTLGGEIRQARRARGLLQEAAAKALGVTQQTVSDWENGQRPDPAHLPAIAKFISLPVEDVAALAYAATPAPVDNGPRLDALEAEVRALRADVNRLIEALERRTRR
jgi:transcriptional regulator with XRE-family HTH domain